MCERLGWSVTSQDTALLRQHVEGTIQMKAIGYNYYTLKDTLCRSYTYRNKRTLEVYRTLQSYHAGL